MRFCQLQFHQRFLIAQCDNLSNQSDNSRNQRETDFCEELKSHGRHSSTKHALRTVAGEQEKALGILEKW